MRGTIAKRTIIPTLIVVALLCLLVVRDARAQESSAPLVLEHADSTEVIRTPTETEYQLYGDVQFTQGETRLRGDRAIWRRESGIIQLDGNVLVRQPNRWISAQSMTYERAGRTVLAQGDVRLEDTSQSFALIAQRARYDRARELAVADSLPVVRWDFILDSASQTIVYADTIIYDRVARRGDGIGHVIVRKGDWVAEGARGTIYPDSNRAVMTGEPTASGIGGTIKGDTLIMEFSGRGVRQVRALGNASGTYHDTTSEGTGTNLIRGRVADFFVENDTLRAIRVVGQAYTDFEPADTTQGSNHASGDSLWLRFDKGRIANMTISGGAQGRYLDPKQSGTADTVAYQAATIIFVPDSNRVDLESDGQLKYGTIVLDAGRVSYWTDRRSLLARGIKESDTSATIQRPVLSDGQQTIEGDQLTYDIDSRRGRIRGSSTQFEGAYYRGGDFRKYTDSVYFVTDGIYTTCELDEPHFRFESKDMEIIRNDKVIARPVKLRIGELPVAMLPYYIFPIKRGRHSGFLPLRFGNFQQGERFIGNAGYYWAASDYWDVQASLDYNEDSGVLLRSGLNYAWRYRFSGNLSGSYTRESRLTTAGTSKSTRWSLRGNHQQTLSPSSSLSGSMDFVSDASFYQNFSFDPTDRRQRTLRSQLNFNKRWKGASLTAYVENTENLDTKSLTRRLPQLEFQMFQRRILSPDSGQDARWFHNGYINYSSRMSHFETRSLRAGDTTGATDTRRYATADHNAAVSFPQKVLRYISVSPNASLQETWYYIFDTPFAKESDVQTETAARRLAGNMGISASTNLYGFLNPKIGGLTTVRHTLSPRIGYTFTPAIVQNDLFRTYTGTGGGSSRRSQILSLSASNTLDAKLGEGETERKLTLLNFGLATGYNFEATSRKWSNLSANARTNISRLELATDAAWDLYNQQTLDLQWTNPTLTNFGVSAATSLRAGISPFTTVTGVGEEFDRIDTTSMREEIPFNLSLSYRYSESRSIQGATFKDHWIGWRVDLQPTANWTLNYQQTYNWARHAVTDQRFELTRDLHCWEMRFLWVPTGSGAGYYFRINVKALPDIRLERSESGVLGAFGRRF
jgi:lipopolysaccharide assembly outer membrane protein LptD (OstA)